METELKILRDHSFISRKDFRELLLLNITDDNDLKNTLIQNGYMDFPDWEEAEPILFKNIQEKKEKSPDSQNVKMQGLIKTALRVAHADTTVLILGESGVGKSRLARRIHESSPRRVGPFITVSCGSIPETLLESELFGVARGAYTGATRSRPGRFMKAVQGTIFLDEVGELTPSLQVKLLRVIQERKIEPLGSDSEVDVDVRVIAATNRDLEIDVKHGLFRKDLYFRLNVIPLVVPPLRERTEDIVPLINFFLDRISKRNGIHYRITENSIYTFMEQYSWPGNIRELENCLERMCVLSSGGILSYDDFPVRITDELKIKKMPVPISEKIPVKPLTEALNPVSLQDVEKEHIKDVLSKNSGNIARSALALGIHRNTLTRKLEEFDIQASQFKLKKRDKNKA